MEDILVRAPARPADRDDQAWVAELFDRHHGRLHRLAARMSRDVEEARDLVQETFLRAARSARSLPSEAGPAEGWLVRTMVNLCRDRSRRLRLRGSPLPMDEAPEPARDPAPALQAVWEVRAALATLPARRRAVVVLHEIEDRPVAEIALLLGINDVTVRWHLMRARRELRERLLPARRGATS
ncbi:MAG TPA: RNA polymerase sigma factor [Candidatus Polarisedimenticolia bacterium]|nr:RNA polymerase sigma factor [Candidatus Polarisedimenticolia bacterium]